MFDLDNFPTKESAKRMMSRISNIYDRSYVAKWIFEVLGAEFDFTNEKLDELRMQSSPDTATWGLKYWEQRYGLEVDETLSPEERRTRILEKRVPRLPINPTKIEAMLSAICKRNVIIKENIAAYTFGIYIESNSVGETPVNITKMFELINKLKPAHQSFRLSFVHDIGIYIRTGTKPNVVKWIVTGTVPGVSTGWRINRNYIDILTQTYAYSPIFRETGNRTLAGLFPKLSVGYVLTISDIDIETEIIPYDINFPITSEDLKTGTMPKQSNSFAHSDVVLDSEASGNAMVLKYQQTGLLPKVSRYLTISNVNAEIEANTEPIRMEFSEAKDSVFAGSAPNQSNAFAIADEDLGIDVITEAAKVTSKLSADGNNVIQEVNCSSYSVNYPMCGDPLNIFG